MKKEKIVFIIAIFIFIFSGIVSVSAAILYNSNEVSYNNSASGLSSTNVQGAIDSLYSTANNYTALASRVTTLEGHDYEKGTDSSSGWQWKKYADGTFDMWVSATATKSNYSKWGSFGAYYATPTFPSSMKPINTSYIVISSIWIGSAGATSSTILEKTTSNFRLFAVSPATGSQNFEYKIYVHGNWK